ncbi:ATPase, T2SS/T4P/T4SS family [uncultured Bifidobacterium sp.]|uniref:CpaF family protein n=1 Tax=uncultured Bifidobacterium sp. TaxID=165187 RepID=UPI0028DC20A5|nr:ATPase, T2SS/T4P/T4SS family [uncultured Bifidobacterium sp.]
MRFGPLEDVVRQPGVSDVAVTPDGVVWVDRGSGMVRETSVRPFRTAQALRDYAVRLCAQMNCRLDDACPIADGSSAEGIRINAVIEPLVPCGASICLRMQSSRAPDLEELAARGMMPVPWLPLLRGLVAGRANLLVAGPTGSGKTTLLRALLRECPDTERVVTVEEVRELGDIGVEDHVSLACREPNVEGAGGIDLSRLVRATLRMRPDRIVVGECRGAEIGDLLRAFGSGHRGGMTTIHAPDVEGVGRRLIALGLLAGMDPGTLTMLGAQSFDAVVHVDRIGGVRRITAVGVLGARAGALAGESLVLLSEGSYVTTGRGWESFVDRWATASTGARASR